MAVSALGTRLTEAHRVAQGRVSARAAQDVVNLWALYDPADRTTYARFEKAAMMALTQRHRESQSVAQQYLRLFREAEGVKGTFQPAAAELNTEAAQTSLLVTGPVEVATKTRKGFTLEEAAARALTATAGAVIRHALSGGRDVITETSQRDEASYGVARVTDGRPCSFCALLASRGPVYKTRDTAKFQPHDACGCQPEIVYDDSDSYRWPTPDAKGWDALYRDSTSGTSGSASLNAFRRAYEAQGRSAS